MRLRYRLGNVFTCGGERLTGNPPCVVEDARVRIFTPAYEMPFAGAPTLGTAQVLRSLRGLGDALALELNAGPVRVRAAATRDARTAGLAHGTRLDAGSRPGGHGGCAAMGGHRPSRLSLRLDEHGSIRVAGEVIELGRGYVEV